MTDPQRTDWRENAACKGSPLPWTRTETARYRDLLVMVAVCERCPSLAECRADMRAHEDYVGVRGGVVWTNPGGSKPQPSARRIEERVCAWCDQPYEKPPEVRWTKYCSPACRYKAKRMIDNESQRRRKSVTRHAGENMRSELESGATTECAGRLREQPPALGQGGSPDMRTEPRSVADVHSGGGT